MCSKSLTHSDSFKSCVIILLNVDLKTELWFYFLICYCFHRCCIVACSQSMLMEQWRRQISSVSYLTITFHARRHRHRCHALSLPLRKTIHLCSNLIRSTSLRKIHSVFSSSSSPTIVKQWRTILEHFNINRFGIGIGIETETQALHEHSKFEHLPLLFSFCVSVHFRFQCTQRCRCHEELCLTNASTLKRFKTLYTFFLSKISTSCSWCSFNLAPMHTQHCCWWWWWIITNVHVESHFENNNNNNNRSSHRTSNAPMNEWTKNYFMISSLQFGCDACIWFEYMLQFESMLIVCVSANASEICRCVCALNHTYMHTNCYSFRTSYQSIEMFSIMNKLPQFEARVTLRTHKHTCTEETSAGAYF